LAGFEARSDDLLMLYLLVGLGLFLYSFKSLSRHGLFDFILIKNFSKTSGLICKEYGVDDSLVNRLGFVVLLNQFLPIFIVFCLPIFFESVDVVAFVVLQKLSMSVSLIAVVVNFAITNRVAALYELGDFVKIKKLFAYGYAAILLISFVVLFVFFMSGRKIHLFIGVDYEGYFDLSLMLLLAQIFFGLYVYSNVFLTMMNSEALIMYANAPISIFGALLILHIGRNGSISDLGGVYVVVMLLLCVLMTFAVLKIIFKNLEVIK
jgi:O-antigen/teichoic acid export membrane protein